MFKLVYYVVVQKFKCTLLQFHFVPAQNIHVLNWPAWNICFFSENIMQVDFISSLIQVLWAKIYVSYVSAKCPKRLSEICPKWDKKWLKIKHPLANIFSSNVHFSALVTSMPGSSVHLLVFVKHESMKTSQANGQRGSRLFSFYQLVSWVTVKNNFVLSFNIVQLQRGLQIWAIKFQLKTKWYISKWNMSY